MRPQHGHGQEEARRASGLIADHGLADDVAAPHLLPLGNPAGRKMKVEANHPQAVVDDHHPAGIEVVGGQDHAPPGHGQNVLARFGQELQASVRAQVRVPGLAQHPVRRGDLAPFPAPDRTLEGQGPEALRADGSQGLGQGGAFGRQALRVLCRGHARRVQGHGLEGHGPHRHRALEGLALPGHVGGHGQGQGAGLVGPGRPCPTGRWPRACRSKPKWTGVTSWALAMHGDFQERLGGGQAHHKGLAQVHGQGAGQGQDIPLVGVPIRGVLLGRSRCARGGRWPG